MDTVEIKNKFDILLNKLSTERSFDVAEIIARDLVGLLDIKATNRFLLNIPRIDAELTRFQLAPGFARQAAAYELPHDDDKPVDIKLFWIKKISKTNLSWIIGLTPNFEDSLSSDYKNVGIDFVVPEACDSIMILLSNRFKVRALELKDRITPTQLEILAQWAKLSEVEFVNQSESKNNLHAKLWESFNFEPINRKFYLELVEHFSILVHHLEKNLGRKPSVMFTTRLIGRLLFIWFLKKKNLVNTDVAYFLVADPEKQSEYYKNKLEKLFFEVLNRADLERSNGDKLTPYLNGGLFDKSNTDFCGDPKLTFPNGYFNQLFITLNKYNFTVDESSPEFQHVAIDPEMLGRIFESLLAEQIDENTGNSKKKATGAFYTPREIVSYMCEQSLIEYLKSKVPDAPDRDRRIDELIRMPEAIFRDQDQNKRRDWKPYRESIIKALEGTKTESALTVLDPAVGSGAFPMGMLHLLVKVYSRLDPKFEKDISGLKRDILSRSLYGVDIEQTAIEITRLRAWLSIIVDIPEGEKVEPLPNLEFKFVCANTLIPLDDTKQAAFFTDTGLKDKLLTIRDDYFKTSSKAKKEKLQKDYLKLTQNASLFDNKKTQQLKSYKPFDISSSAEFYDPELMHGVQAFDIVIGNPPYVGQKGNKHLFDLMKGNVNLEKKMDYWYFFLYEAFDLNKDNGITTFITPNYWTSAQGGKKLRKKITNDFSIVEWINFNENKVFTAGVHTNVFILRKQYPLENEIKCTIFDHKYDGNILENRDREINFFINQSLVLNQWTGFVHFLPQNILGVVNKLIIGSEKLCDDKSNGKSIKGITSGKRTTDGICNINQGIVTGKDKFINPKTNDSEGVFVLNADEINGLYLNIDEKKKIKYFFKNSDIRRYYISQNPSHYFIFINDIEKETELKQFPNIYAHICKYKDILQKRSVNGVLESAYKKGKWWALTTDRPNINFSGEKILCPQRSSLNTFSFSEDEWYASADVYYISLNKKEFSLKYILSILNSKIVYYWLYYMGKRKGETLELYLEPLQFIPIKRVTPDKQDPLISLVDQILTLKKQNKDADTKNLESQIDQLVYKLYDLTPEEIEIVENSIKR